MGAGCAREIWLCGAFVIFSGLTWAASGAVAADPLLEELRQIRPDGRVLQVPEDGVDLERDAFRFHFASGRFHLLAPVAGRTLGAVFLGEGSYRLRPETLWEQGFLSRVARLPEGATELSDRFSEMVLLFTDDTSTELGLMGPLQQAQPDRMADYLLALWKKREAEVLHLDLRLRLLRDLLSPQPMRPGPSFFALVDGAALPPALAGVDALGADALGLIHRAGSEGSFLYVAAPERPGLWYLAPERDELNTGRRLAPPLAAETLDRRVEAQLRPPALQATTLLQLAIRTDAVRFLPVAIPAGASVLASVQRAGAASGWLDLEVVRPEMGAGGEALVLFPEPLHTGEKISLRLATALADGLEAVGPKLYQPASQEVWFASFAPQIPVPTELVFHELPSGFQVVATGREQEKPTRNISVWQSRRPVWDPGFIAGKLGRRTFSEEVGPQLALYGFPAEPRTNSLPFDGEPFPSSEEPLPSINQIKDPNNQLVAGRQHLSWRTEPAVDLLAQLAARRKRFLAGLLPGLGWQPKEAATVPGSTSPRSAPRSTLGQIARSLASLFGPPPADLASVVAWPVRVSNGLFPAPNRVVDIRNLARRWWGYSVQPASYRDRWIEEGLRELAAGTSPFQDQVPFWSRIRADLQQPLAGTTVALQQAAALAAGDRLALLGPAAGQRLTAGKGGYVFYMLSRLLQEPGSEPDRKLKSWLHGLAEKHDGGTLSTDELEASLTPYLPPEARTAEDRPFRWFFEQWVRGTDIPRFQSSFLVEPAGTGVWRVRGPLRQEEVPASFISVVPVYLENFDGQWQRISLVRLEGGQTVFLDVTVTGPERPRRVLVNAFGDVLSRE